MSVKADYRFIQEVLTRSYRAESEPFVLDEFSAFADLGVGESMIKIQKFHPKDTGNSGYFTS